MLTSSWQQMLAYRMQDAHEDGTDRVRVLHISPAANTALKKVTSQALKRLGDNWSPDRRCFVAPGAGLAYGKPAGSPGLGCEPLGMPWRS